MEKEILSTLTSDYTQLSFETIPIDRDCFLVSESSLKQFITGWNDYLSKPDGIQIDQPYEGIRSRWCVINNRKDDYCEINVCITMIDRFHGIMKLLNKESFIACLVIHNYESRPYIFVKDKWFESISYDSYSLYAYIDIIGIKKYLSKNEKIEQSIYQTFVNKIDSLAKDHNDYLFLSFSDNILIKSTWHAHHQLYRNEYKPENILEIINALFEIIKETFGLPSYAIITQGTNNIESKVLSFISKSSNHIAIPSISTPFAEIFDIESTVKSNTHNRIHPYCNLYIADSLLVSMNFISTDIRNNLSSYSYITKAFSQSWNKYTPINIEDLQKLLQK